MLIMLLTLISTYMQNIIWILLVHNLFLAANVCKYTVRYAVRLPFCITFSNSLMSNCLFISHSCSSNLTVRSPVTITSLLLLMLSISACTFPNNSSFSSSVLPCCGAYSMKIYLVKMAFFLHEDGFLSTKINSHVCHPIVDRFKILNPVCYFWCHY